MIGLGVRHRLFDIIGVGKLTSQGTRVTPETQRRGIQRDEGERKAEELENAIAAEMAPRTAHNAQLVSPLRLRDP